MQNKHFATSGLLLLMMILSSCSLFGSKSEYDKVPAGQALEVPPDLDEPSAAGAVRIPNATYSRLANGPVGSDTVDADQGTRLKSSGASQTLIVDDSLESVWRRLGFALQRIGLKIEDQERDRGVYSVAYVDVEARAQRPGRFSRWIMRKKGPTDHSGTYHLHLDTVAEQTRVRLLNANGRRAAAPVTEEILGKLLERLQ